MSKKPTFQFDTQQPCCSYMLIVAITLFVASYTLCTSFFELNGFKKIKINKICCHGTAVQSHKLLLQFLGLSNMGKYSVLGLCIVPPRGRANTATLELNISSYCPPSHAIIYIYLFTSAESMKSSSLSSTNVVGF